ncbi:MAG: hypothetical protein ACM31C_31510 [Acidobacteriota bacterium]
MTNAIQKAYPSSTVTRCNGEREHGRRQFATAVTKADGTRVEVDVAPDGTILLTEERIAVSNVPAAVMSAFAAKYPGAKVTRAEKQTPSHGPATYELGFAAKVGHKEATFTATGKFVEEE